MGWTALTYWIAWALSHSVCWQQIRFLLGVVTLNYYVPGVIVKPHWQILISLILATIAGLIFRNLVANEGGGRAL